MKPSPLKNESQEFSSNTNDLWNDYSWSEEQIYETNNDFFDALTTSIDQAKSSIILATYIFNYDELGKKIIDHLRAAKCRGVDVRVLFDGFGSLETGNKVAKKLEEGEIPIKIFHPLPWQTENYHRALYKSFWFGSFLSYALKINQRHHAKMCIIDNFTLWCGSQNISLDHLTTERSGKSWHDLGAVVTGSGVKAIADGFYDMWEKRKPTFGQGMFQYYWNNITTLARQRKNKLLAEKLRDAKERIWIVNPYFSPPRMIVRGIKNAAQNGADVRIIVPAKSDISFFPLLTATYYEELLRNNVRIFEYKPTILHKKISIIDDLLLLGSTNYNHRSVIHDVEFDIVVDTTHATNVIEKSFLKDQSNSREITMEIFKQQGTRRMLGWIPRLLRYWL
ncbi:MAG: phosphatidylserine/phosphatidylglycerophosphate/cardiolipin synthase family protein [Cellvibrionaceae bacterium]